MKHSLKPWNTFGIQHNANKIVCVKNYQQLLDIWRHASDNGEYVLILGEGSNVLFLEDCAGTILINRIMGIKIKEYADSWHLHVNAGENWHHLVRFTIENGIAGLENLALIPGRIGSSPIQNISAYGIEFKNVCEYVDCIELSSGEACRFTVEQCQFGYRDSIFKHECQNYYVIIAVGLRLTKHWRPVLTYDHLNDLDPKNITPRDIFNAVCSIRASKLPDPKIQGNAGSFFKNPIISNAEARDLLIQWPHAPHYPEMDGNVKLAAGWLIDQCHLKGITKGGAAVHQEQALVLINQNHATSDDIVQLARFVRHQVGKKFNIWLEPEVRFIGRTGEVNAVEIIA